MQREEFISRLEKLLRGLPEAERKDIIYDYDEHIRIAVENGLEEEKVIQSLGSPQSIAKQYRVKKYIDKAEETGSTTSVFRAILATVGLGFFNLVFILGPFYGGCRRIDRYRRFSGGSCHRWSGSDSRRSFPSDYKWGEYGTVSC